MNSARRKAIHEAMVRLSDGDRGAFDELLDQLWPVILSFALRGLGQAADAEDVAQEVFFRICSRISDFDRTRDGLSWAFGIAGFELMTHRRKQQRRREVHDDELLALQPDHSNSQEAELLQRELTLALEQAIGELSEQDRRALSLASVQPERAMSAVVRKRKQRALERLRHLWRRTYGEP